MKSLFLVKRRPSSVVIAKVLGIFVKNQIFNEETKHIDVSFFLFYFYS